MLTEYEIMNTRSSAREAFLKELPNIPIRTLLLRITLVTVLTVTAMFAIILVISNRFKETFIDSALNRFPEIAIYIPAIIIGFFIIYQSNLRDITKHVFPSVTNKSKKLFFSFLILDFFITVLFGLF